MAENTGATTNEAQAATTEPQVIKLSLKAILEDLKNGHDRKAIAKKYKITQAKLADIFQDPRLKGQRVHKPGGEKGTTLEIVDDLPPYVAPVEGAAKTDAGAATNAGAVTAESTAAGSVDAGSDANAGNVVGASDAGANAGGETKGVW